MKIVNFHHFKFIYIKFKVIKNLPKEEAKSLFDGLYVAYVSAGSIQNKIYVTRAFALLYKLSSSTLFILEKAWIE
jgi:hypothetical protein